jgi:hypothetical protein
MKSRSLEKRRLGSIFSNRSFYLASNLDFQPRIEEILRLRLRMTGTVGLITHPIRPIDRHPIAAGLEDLVDELEDFQGGAIYAPGSDLGNHLAGQGDSLLINLVGAGAKLE